METTAEQKTPGLTTTSLVCGTHGFFTCLSTEVAAQTLTPKQGISLPWPAP